MPRFMQNIKDGHILAVDKTHYDILSQRPDMRLLPEGFDPRRDPAPKVQRPDDVFGLAGTVNIPGLGQMNQSQLAAIAAAILPALQAGLFGTPAAAPAQGATAIPFAPPEPSEVVHLDAPLPPQEPARIIMDIPQESADLVPEVAAALGLGSHQPQEVGNEGQTNPAPRAEGEILASDQEVREAVSKMGRNEIIAFCASNNIKIKPIGTVPQLQAAVLKALDIEPQVA